MTDWNDMTTRPEGVFDVLARHYEPGLNRFVIHRFANCVRQDMTIFFTPWPNDAQSFDLAANGFRVLAWRPAPGPEDIPEWLDAFASGPVDRR